MQYLSAASAIIVFGLAFYGLMLFLAWALFGVTPNEIWINS